MSHLLKLDTKNFFARAPYQSGVTQVELERVKPLMEKAKERLLLEWKTGRQGWLGVSDDMVLLKYITTCARMYKKKGMKTCLVIGIGGSDLGARAAYAALGYGKKGMRLVFAGGNTDPVELYRILQDIEPRKTVVNIISKSGDTVEPMTSFLIVRDFFKKKLGKKYAQHIVATTDMDVGSLHALAIQEKYVLLPVPKNIGGRFSILTAVGLFPLACAAIDIKKILKGAEHIREKFILEKSFDNAACVYGALQYIADFRHGQSIQVLMPYSSQLYETGKWFRQLWAESLGKKKNPSDDEGVGPTPVAALGATDQHSQMQLYMEGPRDKTITFIEIEKFEKDMRVPASAKDIPSLSYLSGVSMTRIIHAEREASAQALRDAGRPNMTIFLRDISTESFGALILHFEIATAIAGCLYGINTYDQPGVEAGKRAMYALLGK